MGVTVVIDAASINEVGRAVKANRQVASWWIHAELALAAGCLDDPGRRFSRNTAVRGSPVTTAREHEHEDRY
jgi:hypothetical protein